MHISVAQLTCSQNVTSGSLRTSHQDVCARPTGVSTVVAERGFNLWPLRTSQRRDSKEEGRAQRGRPGKLRRPVLGASTAQGCTQILSH